MATIVIQDQLAHKELVEKERLPEDRILEMLSFRRQPDKAGRHLKCRRICKILPQQQQQVHYPVVSELRDSQICLPQVLHKVREIELACFEFVFQLLCYKSNLKERVSIPLVLRLQRF